MTLLTREQLYERVWTTPMANLASSFGLSDVGLKKICAKHAIPVPQRGYWAKLAVSKPVFQPKLPPRDPGMPHAVRFGAQPYRTWPVDPVKELAFPEPVEPVFAEPLDDVEARIRKRVGKITLIRTLDAPHPDIAKLLDKDAKRRAQALERPIYFQIEPPLFDSPFEQRRLKVLNSLLLGLARADVKVGVGGPSARHISARVGAHHVGIKLDHPSAKRDQFGEYPVRSGKVDRLQLTAPALDLDAYRDRTWGEETGKKLDAQLTDIAVAIVLAGEAGYRRACLGAYRSAVERRAEVRAELVRREEAARAAERQRQEEERQRQRERLRVMARDWRDANDLRDFVAAITAQGSRLGRNTTAWAQWALGVADELDPMNDPEFGVVLEKRPP